VLSQRRACRDSEWRRAIGQAAPHACHRDAGASMRFPGDEAGKFLLAAVFIDFLSHNRHSLASAVCGTGIRQKRSRWLPPRFPALQRKNHPGPERVRVFASITKTIGDSPIAQLRRLPQTHDIKTNILAKLGFFNVRAVSRIASVAMINDIVSSGAAVAAALRSVRGQSMASKNVVPACRPSRSIILRLRCLRECDSSPGAGKGTGRARTATREPSSGEAA
jgi:hypothetical protein